MNPYSNVGFFEFFALLGERVWLFVTGQIVSGHMAADEVQLVVLVCCAIACGLIGPLLVLKKMSMFANSLSHTSLLGIVGAYLLVSNWWGGGLTDLMTLFVGALFAAVLTAGLTETLSRLLRLQEDASIGLVFTTLFSCGVILVSLFTRNAHLSAEAVTGNCDALVLSDLWLSGSIALLNIGASLIFYHRMQLLVFDEPFFRVSGFSAPLWRSVLFLLTALTCIGSFRAIGVLVVLALLVGPFLTMRLFCCRLNRLLLWTPLCGTFVCMIGVAFSRAFLSATGIALSTGGCIAVATAVVFLTAGSFKFVRSKVAHLISYRHST